MQHKTALTDHLQRCTVRLLVNNNRSTGTGFFVARGFILTCAHVVSLSSSNQVTIEAHWNGQSYSATIVRQTNPDYPDLALLQIVNPPDHPCVYLYNEIIPGDPLSTFGYTDHYPGGEPATFLAEGRSGEDTLIKFKEGEVRSGLSGAPLLNQRTGAVCGVVKLTRGAGTSMGGRAISIARAFQEFPEIQAGQTQFHRQDEQWARSLSLGQRHLNGLDKLHLLPEDKPVEIFFSYHDNTQDQKILQELEKHLAMLRRKGIINAWHKGKIALSQSVEEETLRHLNSARVICLLVSASYIADDDLYDLHVRRAMERRASEGVIVIPILARPTADWRDTAFGMLKASPEGDKPISQWADSDEALRVVAQAIKKAVENLKKPEP